MDYRKPSKAAANKVFLRSQPFIAEAACQEETLETKKTLLIICEGKILSHFTSKDFRCV